MKYFHLHSNDTKLELLALELFQTVAVISLIFLLAHHVGTKLISVLCVSRRITYKYETHVEHMCVKKHETMMMDDIIVTVCLLHMYTYIYCIYTYLHMREITNSSKNFVLLIQL